MKKISGFLTFILVFIVTLAGCSKDNDSGGGTTVNCSTVPNKAFAADVSPIIQSVCAIDGCHGFGSANGPGPLTNYTQVFNARVKIRSAVASGAMPQGSTLSSAQKNSIICWIDSGAPNN